MKKSIFIVSAIAMLVSFSSCQGPIADPMSASMKITAIPEAVDIFVDASGSMKGYIDGVQGTLKNVVPNLIPNLMNNDRMGLSTDNINCYTIYNSKLKKQDKISVLMMQRACGKTAPRAFLLEMPFHSFKYVKSRILPIM